MKKIFSIFIVALFSFSSITTIVHGVHYNSLYTALEKVTSGSDTYSYNSREGEGWTIYEENVDHIEVHFKGSPLMISFPFRFMIFSFLLPSTYIESCKWIFFTNNQYCNILLWRDDPYLLRRYTSEDGDRWYFIIEGFSGTYDSWDYGHWTLIGDGEVVKGKCN